MTTTCKYNNMLEQLSGTPSWTGSNEAAIIEPFKYITSIPGKEVRTKLIEAFNVWCGLPTEQVAVISGLVGMLHSASLLVDDVEDNSQLRRGVPVAHEIYGVPQTINTANYVYFLAYRELYRLRDIDAPRSTKHNEQLDVIVTDELINLHRGQGLDLYWRDSLICPTEEEYVSMVNNKTGGLFRIAIKLMMALSNTEVDYVPLGNLLGVYFQIRDDYLNLQSSVYTTNKGFAEDLTEGKFSFPIIHSIKANTTNRQVINVLKTRPASNTTKEYVISYMRDQTKSFEYTLQVMHNLEQQARDEIARLGGNPYLTKIVDALKVPA